MFCQILTPIFDILIFYFNIKPDHSN